MKSEGVRGEVAEGRVKSILLVSLVGLCAGLATWGVLQWRHPFFTVGEEYSIGMGASNEAREALMKEQARADRMNAMVIFAVAGALLGSATAVFARPCGALSLRILTALVVGGLWGAASGYLGAAVFTVLMPRDALPGPTIVGIAQAAAFAFFGGGMGAILSIVSKAPSKLVPAILSGVLAGAGGGLLYPIVASLLMPGQSTTEFIAANSSLRILWLCLPMVAIIATVVGLCAKYPEPVGPDAAA